MDGDPSGIPTLLELSAKTLKTVEANFRIAVFTNILGIFLGAAGLLVSRASGDFAHRPFVGYFLQFGKTDEKPRCRHMKTARKPSPLSSSAFPTAQLKTAFPKAMPALVERSPTGFS